MRDRRGLRFGHFCATVAFIAAGFGVSPVLSTAISAVPKAEARAAIATAQEAASREDCKGVLAALDPVAASLTGAERDTASRMRLICLGREGRFLELSILQKELAASSPRDGLVIAYGVIVAAGENRFRDAAEQLSRLAREAPASFDVLSGSGVREIIRQLSADRSAEARAVRDGAVIALAQANWSPADMPELGNGLAREAVTALVRTNRIDEADRLLDHIDDPESLSSLLIDRSYAALWPSIERRLGPAGKTAVDQYAQEKLANYGDMQASDAALRDAANALLLLGRAADAVDLTGRAEIANGMSEEEIQVAMLRARALALAGRDAQAADFLSTLLTLDLVKTPEAAPALITYAEYLDEIGRPAQALVIARAIQTKGKGVLNDFAMRWIDRSEVCALGALGRAAEAAPAIERLKSLAWQNHAAAVEALLCVKRDAEAAQIALKGLADDNVSGELIVQFQPTGALWAAPKSRLRDLWAGLLARPDVKAAFEKRGRILPKAYWPSPEAQPIPRRRVSDPSSLT
ncbi:tetratricopeptide repeat protein [Rhizorhabdus sp. FW153]|uniref:hypothetical protein n=1 Tax=Rhizorhabdus sp. FW153 TaxID=3400216 RepID=UPI003CF6359C